MIKDDELVRIMAEDGDQGVPREVRYSLQAASTQYAAFFAINPKTGAITLQNTVNRLLESMTTFEPILVRVTATELEEEETRDPEETYTSSVEIAFVIMDSDMMIPKFIYEQYVGELDENSPSDAIVAFPNPFLKRGLKGMFALSLEGDEGTFSVEPSIVRDSSDFIIKVKNSALLDFEKRPVIEFQVVARQVSGTGQASSTAIVRINLIDKNDNPPVFTQQVYQKDIYENITAGTPIIRVQATDADKGVFGAIRYTGLNGDLADRLQLDTYSGLISCATNNRDLDRERYEELQLTVEATDNNGLGNQALARVVLRLRDVNDEKPKFLKNVYQAVMKPDQTSFRTSLQVQAADPDSEEPNNKVRYKLGTGSFNSHFRVNAETGELIVVKQLPVSYPQVSSLNRDERAFEDDVINLNVIAYDLGIPELSESVPVQIYREEYVERFITFIYPKPKIEVDVRRSEIERTLRLITGGDAEIRTVTPYSTQDTSRSVVTAMVRNNVNTVVDIEKIFAQLNGTQSSLKDDKTVVQLANAVDERNSYLTGVVILCILLAILIVLIMVCYLWSICPLYRSRKSRKVVGDESADSERASYLRVDERGNYRNEYGEDRTWWDSLPTCCTDAAISLGVTPPKRGGGRLAWSGDERQRYWTIGGGGEGAPLEDRGGMLRRGGRDLVLLEDLDESRLPQGRMFRVDSRNSYNSQDLRRTVILRDPRGNQRFVETLREGEHYVMEDVDGSPRNMRMDDPRSIPMDDPRMRIEDPRGVRREGVRTEEPRAQAQASVDDDTTYARQGNGEDLRLHASLHGAAPRDDGAAGRHGRPMRRAGMEPGGMMIMTQEEAQRRALMHEDAGGGGFNNRHVEGQYVGVTPRYLQGGSPPLADVQIQTEDQGGRADHVVPKLRIRTPIEEETKSLLEAEGIRSSRREMQRARLRTQAEVEPGVHEDTTSRRSFKLNQPANSLYQHTKSSILRFETTKAKMDEEAQQVQRKESTLSRRNSMSGTEGRRSSSMESRSADGRRSLSQAALDGRRSISQATLDPNRGVQPDSRASFERHGSLPSLETGLEREAARRSVSRHGSLGPQDLQEDQLPAADGKSSQNSEYDYDSPTDDLDQRTRRQRKITPHPRYMEWYDRGQDRGPDMRGVPRQLDINEAGQYIEAREGVTRTVEGRERRLMVVVAPPLQGESGGGGGGSGDIGVSGGEGMAVRMSETREAAEGSETQPRIVQETPSGQQRAGQSNSTSTNPQQPEGEEELKKIMEKEINLGTSQSSQIFEGDGDLEAVAAERGRRKRSHLLEKKSIFTIAYDDMHTSNLRPESAAMEP
ncbi:hypothetical protein Pmani_014032 [Petrolisthes manimaculis]|uniref:Cadherin-related family member 1 n=1 Tax=Petrolisthes manimaculis TaxID=1843537 RepID=A0AAE1PW66_9EUCA|nr:hypothetical protein Pmani_014032 [Petrolisthes manimaculis]